MVDFPHSYRDTVGQGHRLLAQSCRYGCEGEEEQIMQGINFIGYFGWLNKTLPLSYKSTFCVVPTL